MQTPAFNLSARKVGGLTFIKCGRITLSFSVSRAYRPIGAAKADAAPRARSIVRDGRRVLAVI